MQGFISPNKFSILPAVAVVAEIVSEKLLLNHVHIISLGRWIESCMHQKLFSQFSRDLRGMNKTGLGYMACLILIIVWDRYFPGINVW